MRKTSDEDYAATSSHSIDERLNKVGEYHENESEDGRDSI